jgi:phosphatidate cytidylyltransferase
MLGQRITTALVLLAVLGLTMASGNAWAVTALVTLIVVTATWEWARLFTMALPYQIALYVGVAAGFGWIAQELAQVNGVFALPNFVLIAAVFWLLAAPVIVIVRPNLAQKPIVGVALGWIVLLGFAAGLTVLLRRFSPALLLAALAVPVVADSMAYFTGKRFGKHKLAPQVSPKKTIEGALGGLVGVAVIHGAWVWHEKLGWWWVGVFVGLAVYSIFGDLFESLLKRQADVKDSSNLLPGHGGVLDRIDAQLPVVPLAALALQWIELR